jgi:hypothetical protein
MTNRAGSPRVSRRWALWGAAIGAGIPLPFLGPELVRRLHHAALGGRGETALWGEPLFYLVVLALPLSAVGYAAGRVLVRRAGGA